MTVRPSQRFSRRSPCPVCGGFDEAKRGQGIRCFGFRSDDGKFAHCTREENAVGLQLNPESDTYAHRLCGECGCGSVHSRNMVAVKAKQTRREVAAYGYVDERGHLLYQVVRYTPKAFKLRRPDGQGGWIWNAKGVRRVLYRLPLVLRAVRDGLRIYVVEGEKDADALNKLGRDGEAGFVATCNPGGAGKWRHEYSSTLSAAKVTVVADKDPKGRAHAAAVVLDLLTVSTSADLVEPKEGKDATDHLKAEFGVEEFVSIEMPDDDGEDDEQSESDTPSSGGGKASAATLLVRLAEEHATFFHTKDHVAFAGIEVRGHRETWALRSSSFRRWLSHLHFQATGKAAPGQAASDALQVIEGKAVFDSPEQDVHVRVASHAGSIFIDLANSDWEAIEVSPDGWRVVARPPVRFRRPSGILSLPTPERGGSLELLRRFLNSPDESDHILTVAWCLAALRDRGPYPIAVIQGEHGSGKSTRARLLRSLTDPSTVPLRRPPRSERDLAIAASNAHVLAFDNLSGMRDWQSDAFSSLATGGGFGTRLLFTDSDEKLFDAMRPIVINGIDDLTTRSDLADRAVVLRLPEIHNRRQESEYWGEFEKVRPLVLGALLDAVSTSLRRLPEVRLSPAPRMADFASWVVAAESSLGWASGAFLEAYEENRIEAIELGLQDDPVAMAIRTLVTGPFKWEGTAAALLEELRDLVPGSRRELPGSPRATSNHLRRLVPPLREMGIKVEFFREPGGNRDRKIRLSHTSRDSRDAGDARITIPSSDSSVPSDDDSGPDREDFEL